MAAKLTRLAQRWRQYDRYWHKVVLLIVLHPSEEIGNFWIAFAKCAILSEY